MFLHGVGYARESNNINQPALHAVVRSLAVFKIPCFGTRGEAGVAHLVLALSLLLPDGWIHTWYIVVLGTYIFYIFIIITISLLFSHGIFRTFVP